MICNGRHGPIAVLLVVSAQDTVLPNEVKVAVMGQSRKCQKLTKVGLACSLQLY